MSRDKRLVPNEFEVGLSEHDYDKLTPYSKTLITEFAGELRLTRVTWATCSTARSGSFPARQQASDRPVHRCLAGGRRGPTDRPPNERPLRALVRVTWCLKSMAPDIRCSPLG